MEILFEYGWIIVVLLLVFLTRKSKSDRYQYRDIKHSWRESNERERTHKARLVKNGAFKAAELKKHREFFESKTFPPDDVIQEPFIFHGSCLGCVRNKNGYDDCFRCTNFSSDMCGDYPNLYQGKA